MNRNGPVGVSDQLNLPSVHHCRPELMPQVKAEIKRLRGLLKWCLDRIYPQIDGLLRNGLLVDIAAEFHSLDLITESTKDEPSYNKISRELKIRIDILRTQEDLEKHCLDIIVVFESREDHWLMLLRNLRICG